MVTHLLIVLVQRFRAGEPALLSWLDALHEGNGRSGIWLTPNAVLHFTFAGSRTPSIDRPWLDLLMRSASSGPGLIVTDEHGAPLHALSHHVERRRTAPSVSRSTAPASSFR